MASLTLVCQLVDVLISEPELALHVAEAPFVLLPASVEVDGTVQATLYHRPTYKQSDMLSPGGRWCAWLARWVALLTGTKH